MPGRRTTCSRWAAIGTIASLFSVGVAACGRSERPPAAHELQSTASAPERAPSREVPSPHDLSIDERMGGHTLARHVGRTDDELRERLRREPDISSASTYIDRANAEATVAAALSSAPQSFDAWRRRTGRRPNLVLRFDARHIIGRSLRRGRHETVPCEYALVVVRWDDRRQQFYVLTSYPEEHR
jgi:hypothetical protein